MVQRGLGFISKPRPRRRVEMEIASSTVLLGNMYVSDQFQPQLYFYRGLGLKEYMYLAHQLI